MNDRIRELADQCYVYKTETLDIWFNKEKFAELIIRECALLSDQYQFEKNTSNPLRVKPLPLVPSEFINEHFGVEE